MRSKPTGLASRVEALEKEHRPDLPVFDILEQRPGESAAAFEARVAETSRGVEAVGGTVMVITGIERTHR